MPTKAGITLAELLIALAILGVIAMFTIPKLLTSQADAQKKAIFRESIAAMSSVVIANFQTGTMITAADWGNTLNTYRFCQSNYDANGCWSAAIQGNSPCGGCSSEGGFILHNGLNACGLNPGVWYDGFALDINGVAGPNIVGQDQIQMHYCLSASTCSGSVARVGVLLPYADATNQNFYAWIFQ